MHRVPEEDCVGGSVYVCSLGISQTCGGREDRSSWSCVGRQTQCQEGEQCKIKTKTCQREKCFALLVFVLEQLERERARKWMREWKKVGKIQIHAVWDSRITNGFFLIESQSLMRRQVERGQATGRRSRSEGGMIAMQVASTRAWITTQDLMVWRQSNELCSVHNFT